MPAIFNERTKWALRARLLEIGWEHLLRKGFRALRIEDITQEAGIGKGTFYGFFPSKDDFDPDALERAVDVLIDVTVDVLFGTRPGTPGPGAGAATPRQA